VNAAPITAPIAEPLVRSVVEPLTVQFITVKEDVKLEVLDWGGSSTRYQAPW
jgi:hypothetical protein